jgi:hypothetical protein
MHLQTVSSRGCEEPLQRAERARCRHLRPLPQDQELPLARERTTCPRLPSAPRRTCTQISAITDAIAERVRKIRCTTIRSVGQIARLQLIADNDEEFVGPTGDAEELHSDNKHFCGEPSGGARDIEQSQSPRDDRATSSMRDSRQLAPNGIRASDAGGVAKPTLFSPLNELAEAFHCSPSNLSSAR